MSGRRLDLALTRAGLARSRTHARRIIEEGRARIDGRPARRPADPVADGARLAVADVPDGVEYASRAAHKLIGALDAVDLPVRDLVCLDAGASTGGFTDVLLRRGAARVHAVDIGHDQLAAHVRADVRVVVRDGTSVRDLTPQLLGEEVDLVVADLSFISLRTVLAALAGVVRPGGDLLVMVKPQFEVGRAALPRTGVVSDPAERERAVREVAEAAAAESLRTLAARPSPLAGQEGNREYFLHLRRGGSPCALGAEACDMIGNAVHGPDPGSAPTPRTEEDSPR